MAKQLIVNADDLGISPGVSQGIMDAHQQGIVTSTTAMMNMPAAADAIRQAKQKTPELGLGLHLNVSQGLPISPDVPSLHYTDGRFAQTYHELMDAMANFTAEDLRVEFNAQMARFIEVAGHPPDHIDTHHGSAHFVPAAFDVLCKLAQQYNLPIRSPVWCFKPQTLGHIAPRLGKTPDALAEELQAVYRANGSPRHPIDHDLGRDFYDDGATRENLLRILNNLPDGILEIMCHPGYPHDLDEVYVAQRQRELDILTDPSVREAIDKQGIELVTFTAV